jgi:hypothetical protein
MKQEANDMKEVATLTIHQDPDEPRLKLKIYRGNTRFYISIESNHPAIPPSMPVCIAAANFVEAKSQASKLLHMIRGVFRQASGKAPDLPEDMKEIESEMPALLHHLLTNNALGQN